MRVCTNVIPYRQDAFRSIQFLCKVLSDSTLSATRLAVTYNCHVAGPSSVNVTHPALAFMCNNSSRDPVHQSTPSLRLVLCCITAAHAQLTAVRTIVQLSAALTAADAVSTLSTARTRLSSSSHCSAVNPCPTPSPAAAPPFRPAPAGAPPCGPSVASQGPKLPRTNRARPEMRGPSVFRSLATREKRSVTSPAVLQPSSKCWKKRRQKKRGLGRVEASARSTTYTGRGVDCRGQESASTSKEVGAWGTWMRGAGGLGVGAHQIDHLLRKGEGRAREKLGRGTLAKRLGRVRSCVRMATYAREG